MCAKCAEIFLPRHTTFVQPHLLGDSISVAVSCTSELATLLLVARARTTCEFENTPSLGSQVINITRPTCPCFQSIVSIQPRLHYTTYLDLNPLS